MPKSDQIEMEMKLREITRVNGPDQQFVESLWQKFLQQEETPMKPNKQRSLFTRPVFIILAVAVLLVGALFIGFGPQKVSAFIRDIFSSYDPGLQEVEEAGLVTDLGLSAEPALLPEEELSEETHQIYPVGLSQTIEGSTLTLDWVYVDEGRLALAYTTQELQEGLEIGEPILTFTGYSPKQQNGSIQSLDEENNQTLYVSYQLIQMDAAGEFLNFSADLPLIHPDDPNQTPVAQFHFDLTDVPLYRGFTVYLQQIHQVTLNGVSVQLKSVQIAPDFTDVVLCSGPANGGVSLEAIQDATFQFGEGPTTAFSSQSMVDGQCSRLRFDLSNPDKATSATFTLNTLAAADSEDPLSGPWSFYMDIPTAAIFTAEESAEPTVEAVPLASQTQSDVTVTLDWVFVDALRAGVGYTITGLPEVPEATGLLGEIYMHDAEGNLIDGSGVGSSEINRVEGEPGVIKGTWSAGFREPLQVNEIQLEWVITLDGTETMYAIAGFPMDPEATPYPRGEHPPFLPDSFIGTYTFDFTAEVHPFSVLENLPPTTVNDIQMVVPKALVTPSMSKVMVCYQKPTEKDWWIYEASLGSLKENSSMTGGYVVYDTDYTLKPGSAQDGIEWIVPADFQAVEHGRCLILNFLQGQSNPTSPLILTVDGLQVSPPEIYPEDDLAAAREILKEQGIEFDYWTTQGQGGGGGGIDFPVLPEGMTREEAYRKFNEAMGYIFTGPWQITLIE
jgi:hypothetical protein